MKQRKKFFDDYIFYCPVKDQIYIGRPDIGYKGKWQWFVTNFNDYMRPVGKPDYLIEIGREPEMSMFQ